MTKILAFGSFKQSGKSSTCQFLTDVIKTTKVSKLSEPFVTDFAGNRFEFYESPTVKVYSFADKLKQFAVECLGLSEVQVYGSDEDKNSLTHLKWADMPTKNSPIYQGKGKDTTVDFLRNTHMTAREVLQYFGTEICRNMYANIWADACIRQIQKDGLDFALIADTRFVNEAQAIQKAGGKVIGFMRRPFPNDTHQSEVDLIGYPFDATIDNTNLSLDEKNEKVLKLVKGWGWL